MLRCVSVIICALAILTAPARAQQAPRGSECLAMAQTPPRAIPVSLRKVAAKPDAVTITYAGHSTYFIDTPGGVRIATDYNGVYQTGRLPDIATMNRAHSTHYTLFPDKRITHVMHGWGDDGKPAQIHERLGDVLVRNVTTDIRRYMFDESSAEMVKDGNSIFIFEVAGLCIGHLGHLHHKLDDSHIAAIGRLDVVMVPIDDSVTLSLDGMAELTKKLRASIVLPMHRFSTPLSDFVQRAGQQFEVDMKPARSFSVSLDTLPKAPTIVVLDGV
jgi:L-ascorbate metabolism protein UlaG (beta-lactamase superfamily)